jgi:hypothetical protein
LRIRPIVDPRLYPLVIGERVRDKIAKTQLDVRPMSWPPSAKVRARLIVIDYDPLVMADGIAPSDDPVLLFRSPSYGLSYARRLQGL